MYDSAFVQRLQSLQQLLCSQHPSSDWFLSGVVPEAWALQWENENSMVPTGSRKEKRVLVYQKMRGIRTRVDDLLVHTILPFSRVSWCHDLEGNISLAVHIVGHPDDRETAMAQLVVYAIPVGEDFPDADRIVQPLCVVLWVFCHFIELVFIIRVHKVAAVGGIWHFGRYSCRSRYWLVQLGPPTYQLGRDCLIAGYM